MSKTIYYLYGGRMSRTPNDLADRRSGFLQHQSTRHDLHVRIGIDRKRAFDRRNEAVFEVSECVGA